MGRWPTTGKLCTPKCLATIPVLLGVRFVRFDVGCPAGSKNRKLNPVRSLRFCISRKAHPRQSLSFAWNELLAAPWALQVLPIDALVVLRLDLSAAVRTCGVRKRPNLF